eukprot:TRINITY_DN1859_c0_g1_i3.p1 TRINITY_DN1859_c0_g1~~TRINITY_DN1859_c0_g1_i3.p1  ORF type:complete len:552 (+),score=180.83 TRINITY_DN1859_c0_g1_i3:43-1656(+)
MDSTLELLNYSPKLVISKEGEDDNGRLSSEQLGTEESGFQEDSQYSPSSSSSYPPPHAPFESWFISESDLLILFELLGEFYDEEFDRLSYPEKKSLKDKVRVSVPKSHEELLRLYPDEASFLGEASSSPMNPRRPMGPEERDNDLGRLLEEESTNNEGLLQEQHQTQHEHEEEEKNKNPKQREEDFAQSTHHPEEDEEDEEEERTLKDFSEWFEPLEELILFDILGIDYREAFEAMSNPERRELRRKVDNTEPKSKEEILAMLEGEEEEEEEMLPLETPRRRRDKSRRLTLIAQSPLKTPSRVSCCSQHRDSYSRNVPSYQRPTSASAHRDLTPRSRSKLHCPRLYDQPLPASFPRHPIRRPYTGIDLSKVVSPVAQYIHSSPVPTLIRSVRSQKSRRALLVHKEEKEEEENISGDAKENVEPPRETQHFPELPQANYKSSPLLTEQELDNKRSPYFSPTGLEPKIFRHLGRVKVPKTLQLSETEDLQKLLLPGSPGKMTLRKNKAASEADPDDSMIDMSVHEVKAIRPLNMHLPLE